MSTQYHVFLGPQSNLRLAQRYTLDAAMAASRQVRGTYMLYRAGDDGAEVAAHPAICIRPDDFPQAEAAADAVDFLNLVRWYQAHAHAPGRCVLDLLQLVGPFLATAALHARDSATPVPEAVLDLCEALAGLKN